MQNFIYLSEALAEMRRMDAQKKPVPFNLKIREFNRQNKSAGRVKEYKGATLMRKGKKRKTFTDPRHWENRTRNIKLPDGSIKKIHIIFIDSLNGKKIVF
ncbi:MAG: hypothetical protein Q4F57_02540 [Weeksellaceae bacterium]|nr:hypothetical protein [Weeksellaceae bacterium]